MGRIPKHNAIVIAMNFNAVVGCYKDSCMEGAVGKSGWGNINERGLTILMLMNTFSNKDRNHA